MPTNAPIEGVQPGTLDADTCAGTPKSAPPDDFFAEQLAEAQSDPTWTEKWGAPPKGPVRLLCDEIEFPWDSRLEREDVFVGFVRGLVAEVAQAREFAAAIAHLTGKPPSEGSLRALNLAEGMLSVTGARALIGGAKMLSNACDELNPEEAYPTDHLIDMLSSCASAIWFGLESPCRSRHAAHAAQHVWKHIYGVSRSDSHTPAWERAWARSCLQNAIISLLPAVPVAPEEASPRQVSPPIREALSPTVNPIQEKT